MGGGANRKGWSFQPIGRGSTDWIRKAIEILPRPYEIKDLGNHSKHDIFLRAVPLVNSIARLVARGKMQWSVRKDGRREERKGEKQ